MEIGNVLAFLSVFFAVIGIAVSTFVMIKTNAVMLDNSSALSRRDDCRILLELLSNIVEKLERFIESTWVGKLNIQEDDFSSALSEYEEQRIMIIHNELETCLTLLNNKYLHRNSDELVQSLIQLKLALTYDKFDFEGDGTLEMRIRCACSRVSEIYLKYFHEVNEFCRKDMVTGEQLKLFTLFKSAIKKPA